MKNEEDKHDVINEHFEEEIVGHNQVERLKEKKHDGQSEFITLNIYTKLQD